MKTLTMIVVSLTFALTASGQTPAYHEGHWVSVPNEASLHIGTVDAETGEATIDRSYMGSKLGFSGTAYSDGSIAVDVLPRLTREITWELIENEPGIADDQIKIRYIGYDGKAIFVEVFDREIDPLYL